MMETSENVELTHKKNGRTYFSMQHFCHFNNSMLKCGNTKKAGDKDLIYKMMPQQINITASHFKAVFNHMFSACKRAFT